MQLEISREKVPLALGGRVSYDMEELFEVSEAVVDVSMSTLPFDAEHIQLITVVTRRSDDEQAVYEAAVARRMMDTLGDIDLDE